MTQAVADTSQGPVEYRLEGRGPVVMVLNGGHCTRASRLSIGISAAGPAALAFAQRHARRTRRVILESAVTLAWDEKTKHLARAAFGLAAPVTWAAMHLMMRCAPRLMIRTLLRDLTTLDPGQVLNRMSIDDIAFVHRMIAACGPGGFVNDLEHAVDGLDSIAAPVMAMYSPHDHTVSPRNSLRLSNEISECQLFEVPCDTHLIWIGPSAGMVWEKRLSFLTA